MLVYLWGYFVVSISTNVANDGWGRYIIVGSPLVWAVAAWVPAPMARRYALYILLGSQALVLAGTVLKHFLP